jgi:hypothetical protein
MTIRAVAPPIHLGFEIKLKIALDISREKALG